MAKTQVISTLPQIALLAFRGGDPSPDVPGELISKLADLIQQGMKVLVVETSFNWLVVLQPRIHDEGLVLAFAYQRSEGKGWHEEPIVMDKELKCRAFFGGPILSLDGLAEISHQIKAWVNAQ